jgi:hypothetical protein
MKMKVALNLDESTALEASTLTITPPMWLWSVSRQHYYQQKFLEKH